jgi:hypothetical protein
MHAPEPFFADDALRALLDPRAPAVDPVIQAIQVAMSGFGYNFYDARNVARANDQLVRERASDVLGEAANALGKLERGYKQHAFPESTREQPFPPADVMRRLREIDAARKRCEALVATLHTAETPATDAIWFRFRDEATLLQRLVAFDVALATGSTRARDAALALDAAAFDDASLAPIDAVLAELERGFAARKALLKGG